MASRKPHVLRKPRRLGRIREGDMADVTQPITPPPPLAAWDGDVEIGASSLRTMLQRLIVDQTRLLPLQNFNERSTFSDTRYVCVPSEFVLAMINSDPVLSESNYHREVFDCDDYAMYLRTRMALYCAARPFDFCAALGILITSKHAFNFFAESIDGRIRLTFVNTESGGHEICTSADKLTEFLKMDGASTSNQIEMIYI